MPAKPHIRPRHWTASCLLALALTSASCSSGTDTQGARGGTAPASPSSTGAAAAGTGAAATTSPGSTTGNNSTLLVPTAPAAPGAGAAGSGPAAASGTGTTISRDPVTIDECGATNPAGLSGADAQKLKAAGAPGALKLLYPYEGTVFPRGLIAPDVMWSGGDATAVYVHIKSRLFEYTGCLKPNTPQSLSLPQDPWDKAGQRTFGRDETFQLELAVLSQGNVVGPVTLHFQIAQASIKGSIYYNSYSSMLAAQSGGAMMPAGGAFPGGGFPGGGFPGGPGGGVSNGAVLRIPAGGKAEVFGATDCNGCHSVSANGARLLSQFVGTGAQSYDLAAMSKMPAAAGPNGAFGALYPDGSTYLAGSMAQVVARASFVATGGAQDATLYDAKTGMTVPNQGIPPGVLMPMFSPDGTFLVFNDNAIDQAHGLALMRYDVASHTASEYKILMREPAGSMLRPGWPFMLPDNGAAIFVRTDGADWSGNGAGVMIGAGAGGFGMIPGAGGGAGAPISDLSIVDARSGTVTLLAKAMGFDKPEDAAGDKTYLPFGAEELHHSYFPTVSPVAAGGYFWVFFDAVRHYGSLGSSRQLWGTAVDISADGSYAKDPSHPAFFLPGQEFGTGNHRAFAALDACRKDGDKCTSGIDCCGGFCYIDGPEELAEPVGTCSPKMKQMCSKRDERCTRDADCCLPEPGKEPYSCIAGFCALIPPPG